MSDGEVVMADEPKYKVAADFKATVKLYSGKEVVIDLMKVTTKEWKEITKPSQSNEDEAGTISKACGIPVNELLAMPQPDYRMIVDSFIRLGTQPLTNPS